MDTFHGGITIRITASLINAAAVLAGGGVGLLLKGKIPRALSESIIRAIGLCVCVIGLFSALKGDFMLLIASLALGALTGELINIDGRLNNLGLFLQKKLSSKDKNSMFAEGFVTATLLFCVGAMSVVGSINSGLNNDKSVILSKSALDCVSAMVFASTLGAGVLLSAAVIIVYQGSIEFFAGYLHNVLTDALITQISAAGGIMILGIGLNMVISDPVIKTKIKVANLLPGLLFAAGYYYLFLNK